MQIFLNHCKPELKLRFRSLYKDKSTSNEGKMYRWEACEEPSWGTYKDTGAAVLSFPFISREVLPDYQCISLSAGA